MIISYSWMCRIQCLTGCITVKFWHIINLRLMTQARKPYIHHLASFRNQTVNSQETYNAFYVVWMCKWPLFVMSLQSHLVVGRSSCVMTVWHQGGRLKIHPWTSVILLDCFLISEISSLNSLQLKCLVLQWKLINLSSNLERLCNNLILITMYKNRSMSAVIKCIKS